MKNTRPVLQMAKGTARHRKWNGNSTGYPELAKPLQALLPLVPGDQGRVDGPHRGTGKPDGPIPALPVQALVDAPVVGAEANPTGKHQGDVFAFVVRHN